VNVGIPSFIKQTLLNIKIQINLNKIIVGDFNTSLSLIDRSFRQKVNKKTLELNETIHQMGLTDIYRIF
jgi:hypothetical protein